MVILLRIYILAIFLVATNSFAQIALNFRDTAGFVTDIAPETFVQGQADVYPTSRGGFTFGYVSGALDMRRDRTSGNDRRLAGVNQITNSGTQAIFRIDLGTAGTKIICLAVGDATFASTYQYLQIRDTSTPVLTIDKPTGTLGNNFWDAAGVTVRTAAAWPASQTCVSVTFTTTILNLALGTPSAQASSSSIAHISITNSGGGSLPLFLRAIGED